MNIKKMLFSPTDNKSHVYPSELIKKELDAGILDGNFAEYIDMFCRIHARKVMLMPRPMRKQYVAQFHANIVNKMREYARPK